MRRSPRSIVLAVLGGLLAGLATAGGPPPVEPGDLLGSTGLLGASLISIDPATGAGSFRFPLGSLGPVTEIVFRQDGTLFGTTGAGSSRVITIDPDTGQEILVGTHPFGAVNGLAFVGDTLYGAFFQPPGMGGTEGIFLGDTVSLVIVDQTDGSLTLVGPITGFFIVQGLAYDASTATMYGVGNPFDLKDGGLPSELFTIDLATGAPTPIGPTGFEVVGGIRFAPDGTLYGGVAMPGGRSTTGGGSGAELGAIDLASWAPSAIGPIGLDAVDGIPLATGDPLQGNPRTPTERGGVGGGPDAELVTIDLATGAATVVGPTGSPAISGLAIAPGAVPRPTLEVPTLSGLGLFLLATAIAAGGWLLLRVGRPS